MKKIIASTLAAATVAAVLYSTSTTQVESPKIDYSSVVQQQFAPVEFTALQTGAMVEVRLSPALVLTGTINTVQTDTAGITRIGGDLVDGRGVFVYSIAPDNTVCGLVTTSSGVVYELDTATSINYIRKNVHAIMCVDHPGDLEEAAAAVEINTTSQGTIGKVPMLASRPNAKVQLYVDFDGETIQDPAWNGGKVIKAQPAPYREAQIRDIWSLVAERFSPFDVNVTTRKADYDAAKVNARMRVIVTPTNDWRRNVGGIAFMGSMARAGTGVTSPTIPAFVFTNMFGRTKSVAESIAHEAGHVFGLAHDGTRGSAYYTGHGNWAPIMGTAYNSTISQWSKGEYNNANNTQDDVAIIAAAAGFAGGTVSVGTLQGVVNDRFVLCNSQDVKSYNVNLPRGGTINLTAAPGAWSAADVKIDVVAANGVVASGSLAGSQAATINRVVAPGVYQVRIAPVGDGDPKTNGYSAYGSIGTVVLAGSIQSR